MKKLFKYVSSAVLIVIWGFVCGEVIVRLISSFHHIYNIEMLKYANSMVTTNTNSIINHQHKPYAHEKLMGVDIKLNSLGHRSPELHNPKVKNEKRVHVIGSSMVLGWGVSVDEGFVAKLGDLLNNQAAPEDKFSYKMINGGIANYNTFHQVELFKKQVDATKPDLVILTFYIKDAKKNVDKGNGFIKKSHFATMGYPFFSAGVLGKNQSLESYYDKLYGGQGVSRDWQSTKDKIIELREICKNNRLLLVAILWPDLHSFSKGGPLTSVYNKIEDGFKKMEVNLINPLPALEATFGDKPSESWVAPDDPHGNSAVHAIVAEKLFEYLSETNF